MRWSSEVDDFIEHHELLVLASGLQGLPIQVSQHVRHTAGVPEAVGDTGISTFAGMDFIQRNSSPGLNELGRNRRWSWTFRWPSVGFFSIIQA